MTYAVAVNGVSSNLCPAEKIRRVLSLLQKNGNDYIMVPGRIVEARSTEQSAGII